MKTPVSRLTLFFSILILFSISAFAIGSRSISNDWIEYGNIGAIYGSYSSGASNLLFASNNPLGNTNYTIKKISQQEDYFPLISDLNSDSDNEIVTLSGSSATLYNNLGDYLSDISLNGSICGNANIVNKYHDQYRQLMIMTNYSSTGYNLYTISLIGSSLTIDNVYPFTSSIKNGCNILGGFQGLISTLVYTIFANSSIMEYDAIANSTITYTGATYISGDANTYNTNKGILGGGQSLARITSSSNNIIAWYSKGQGINTFDTTTHLFNSKSIIIASDTYPTVAIANIGAWSGTSEYILESSESATNTAHFIYIYNNGLTNVLSDTSGDSGTYGTKITVGDLNLDGQNEFCRCNGNNFHCWDSSYTKTTYTNSTIVCNAYLTMMEIDNTSILNWKELVTESGIYQFYTNDSGNISINRIYTFPTITGEGVFIPIFLDNKLQITNDLVYAGTNELYLFTASGISTICGNNICEPPENFYTCFTDCYFQQSSNTTVGTLANGMQCLNDSWCVSGKCDLTTHLCSGLEAQSPCTQNDVCQSGKCENGYCTRVSIVAQIQEGINNTGFFDPLGKLLISILIIFSLGIFMALFIGGENRLIGFGIGTFLGLVITMFVFFWVAVWLFIALIIILAIIGLIMYFTRNLQS